jgi:long-chain acyl-CoA synthetase
MADTHIAQMFFDRARAGGSQAAYLVRQGASFTEVSWASAAERVRAIASGVLKSIPLAPGTCVTLMANTRVEWILCDFAMLSLGLRTVPIYVSLLAPEVGYIHADTGAELLVVENREMLEKVRRRAMASISTTRSTQARR